MYWGVMNVFLPGMSAVNPAFLPAVLVLVYLPLLPRLHSAQTRLTLPLIHPSAAHYGVTRYFRVWANGLTGQTPSAITYVLWSLLELAEKVIPQALWRNGG